MASAPMFGMNPTAGLDDELKQRLLGPQGPMMPPRPSPVGSPIQHLPFQPARQPVADPVRQQIIQQGPQNFGMRPMKTFGQRVAAW